MTRHQLANELQRHEARILALKADLYDEEQAVAHLRALLDAWGADGPDPDERAQLEALAAKHGLTLVHAVER
jgi:protein-disulfide isomerase-like protein with CxxC motif